VAYIDFETCCGERRLEESKEWSLRLSLGSLGVEGG